VRASPGICRESASLYQRLAAIVLTGFLTWLFTTPELP
jgi:hypothetical protein